MKYCQGTNCHKYDTTDRKRGSKGNKRNQTRSISTYSYGNGSFCTLTCQNDWWAEHGQRAIDHFGRLEQPIILTEDNAWSKEYNHDWYENQHSQQRYIERNTITRATRPCEQGDS